MIIIAMAGIGLAVISAYKKLERHSPAMVAGVVRGIYRQTGVMGATFNWINAILGALTGRGPAQPQQSPLRPSFLAGAQQADPAAV